MGPCDTPPELAQAAPCPAGVRTGWWQLCLRSEPVLPFALRLVLVVSAKPTPAHGDTAARFPPPCHALASLLCIHRILACRFHSPRQQPIHSLARYAPLATTASRNLCRRQESVRDPAAHCSSGHRQPPCSLTHGQVLIGHALTPSLCYAAAGCLTRPPIGNLSPSPSASDAGLGSLRGRQSGECRMDRDSCAALRRFRRTLDNQPPAPCVPALPYRLLMLLLCMSGYITIIYHTFVIVNNHVAAGSIYPLISVYIRIRKGLATGGHELGQNPGHDGDALAYSPCHTSPHTALVEKVTEERTVATSSRCLWVAP
jgi:hypothetical protein